jgi:hypothetical protein
MKILIEPLSVRSISKLCELGCAFLIGNLVEEVAAKNQRNEKNEVP